MGLEKGEGDLFVTDSRALCEDKIGRLLRWEKSKRRERILVTALFYSLLLSLAFHPMGALFPPWARPLSATPVFFFAAAVLFFLWRPWGGRDALRSVLRLDRRLGMQERALTAWEILRRQGSEPAERLVVEQAASALEPVDVRGLFQRRLSWHAFVAPPLFLLWLGVAWFGVGGDFDWFKLSRREAVKTVAAKLKEFSRELGNRAEEEGLGRSLKAARLIEEVAEKGLAGKMAEAELGQSLHEAVRGLRDLGPGDPVVTRTELPAMSQKALADLRAEAEKIRDSLTRSDSTLQNGILSADVLQRLTRFTSPPGSAGDRSSGKRELDKSGALDLLQKLEQETRAELDRRALMEAQAFLLSLLDGMEGDTTTPSERKDPSMGSDATVKDDKAPGNLPGDQPGSKPPQIQFPRFKARAETHLKSLFNEGARAGFTVRGELPGRESQLPKEEIVTEYQRQVEGDLAATEIPQDLKETVKSYFLSLGMVREGARDKR